MEARERAEQADRLKIKYDYMIKSLGEERGDKEGKKSEEGRDKVNNSDLYNQGCQDVRFGMAYFLNMLSQYWANTEASPIKCAGRESAGLPALSHTRHTKRKCW